jgi:hypothetical protein
MALTGLLTLLAVHFVADFVLQSRWMAMNKSTRLDALAAHCLVYALCFIVPFGLLYSGVNGLLHFGVDFVTSRITARLWQQQDWRWFFIVIGADQLIHYVCLVLTAKYL